MRVRYVLLGMVNALSFVFGVAFSLVILAATCYLIYTNTIKAYSFGEEMAASMVNTEKPDIPVEVVINEGDTVDEVSAMLEETGIIGNAMMFRLENMLKGVDKNYTAGTYLLNMNMDQSQINAALRGAGRLGQTIKITIREGFTLKDIGEYLEANEVISAEEFYRACEENDFKYRFLDNVPLDRKNRLEGYLFPDTYFLTEEPTADEIIHKMLIRFTEIWSDEYMDRAADLGFSMDEVIKMASIIEKEIKRPEERALASQVIHNRLSQDIQLQMCSTILYILEIRKERLTYEDLEIESPYNTYLNKGLPDGPICNPGEACIRAALYPDEGDYLFFVVKDEESGEHFFTEDYGEFENAKIEYNQRF